MASLMKWYKKQLDQLKNGDEKKLKEFSILRKSKAPATNAPSPVKARNQNRPKTDLY